MFVLKNFFLAFAKIIDIGLYLYTFVIVFRALVSWVNADPYNPIVVFLYRVTEPVLRPIRRLPFLRNSGIDLSPVIVILIIFFLQFFLVQTLTDLAHRL